MLVEKTDFNKEEFIKLFNKKFSNFSEKCPLFLQFQIVNDYVLVEDKSYKETKHIRYDFDYTLTVKENIKNIKDILVGEHYPIFHTSKIFTFPLNALEIDQKMQKENLSFKEASSIVNKKVVKTFYRVEKIINQDNRLVIRKLDSNEEPSLYQLKMPVILFLKEVFENSNTVGTLFEEKAEFIKYVPDITTA